MKEESEYTEAEIKEIQTKLYKDMRRDAMEKLKRKRLRLKIYHKSKRSPHSPKLNQIFLF